MRGAVAAVRLLPAAADLPSAPPGGRYGKDITTTSQGGDDLDDDDQEEDDSHFGL